MLYMLDKKKKDIEHIISILQDAGYDPYEQLYAYAITGNEIFITRKGDARHIISSIEREELIEYILPHMKEKI